MAAASTTLRRFASLFSPGTRTVIAASVLACLSASAAITPVFLRVPATDEVTWADRSLRPIWGSPFYDRQYYYALHHPCLARIVYGLVLRASGVSAPPDVTFDYSLTYDQNRDRGNYLPYHVRTPMRVTNAAFVLAAVLTVFFGLMRIYPNRLLAALAVLPIIYEPTLIKAFNSVIGYVGADAILLFMLVLFWFAWLALRDRGWWAVLVLGVLGGLCASTKYNGAVALVAAMLYYAFYSRGWRRLAVPLAMGAVAVAVFVTLNPLYLGGGGSGMWKVFRDALALHVRGQSPRYIHSPIDSPAELFLALFPYLPFLVPVLLLLGATWRSQFVRLTTFWAAPIILGNALFLKFFFPTYAAPGRIAFIVLVAAASFARIAASRRALAAAAAEPPAPGPSPEPVLAIPAGPEPRLRILAAAALVVAIAAFDLLAPDMPAMLLAAALIAAVFAGSLVILENSLAAALTAITLALQVPWHACPQAYYMTSFSLAAAAIWLLYLYLKRLPASRHSLPLVASTAAVCFALSPQILVLLAAAALWYRLRPASARRPLVAAAIVVPVALVILVQWALGASLAQLIQWRQFLLIPAGHWMVTAWSDSVHSIGYNNSIPKFAGSLCWPLIAPLAALAWGLRRQWWFPATYAGAALMLAGTVLVSGKSYFQYSLPLEMGLLVPLTIAGLAAVRSESPALLPLVGPRAGFGPSLAG